MRLFLHDQVGYLTFDVEQRAGRMISLALSVWGRVAIEEISERKWISCNDYEIDALAGKKRKRKR